MQILKLYNNNSYLRFCDYLTSNLNEIRSFIKEIRDSNEYYRVSELIDVYKQTFSYVNTKGFTEMRIERVLVPYTVNRNKSDLKPGNCTFFISIKLSKKNLIYLDKFYDNQLTSLLRFYKSIFSIVNSPEKTIQDEILIKYESLIEEITQGMRVYLSSLENKEMIERRKKLALNVIKNLPFNGFYHMTHCDNLKSILSEGLLCHKTVHSRKLVKIDISNIELQKRRNRPENVFKKNIQNYVPLYMNPSNPMMSSKRVSNDLDNIILLEIFPHILVQEKETLFSDGNAAIEKTNFYKNPNKLEKVDWNLLKEGNWEIGTDSQRIMCSEVLIPERIEVFYINKIVLRNENNIDKIIQCFPNHLGIPVQIDSTYFKIENKLNK